LEALALANMGDPKRAHRLADTMPNDCVLCLRVHGRIDAAEHNWSGAAWWFARAESAAPSLPLPDSDWGAMLLRAGRYDDAIAKFTLANRKGPHFADPLEMWGEALIAKNRSDLALGKFEEADKYAPNWGRLHLKWGEALLWSGKRGDAQKQFAIGAHLDLSAADKTALARVSTVPNG
jgi:tetratricopeptide (TPR) repeat protein